MGNAAIAASAASYISTANRSGAGQSGPRLDSVINGAHPGTPGHRLALSVVDRDERYVMKTSVQRLELGHIQPPVKGRYNRDTGVARQQIAPVVDVTVDQVEDVLVVQDGINGH